jgi:DNA-binding transcriptional LysR family regulator
MHNANARENWDDLRYVLAVAETGSVSAAARRLGVNHATVLRRISAFEERQGSAIFERTPQGYQIPSDRLRVIEAAREVENAIATVDRLIHGAEAQLSGVIRITSTDTFCQTILPAVIAKIVSTSPGLRVELSSTNAHLDLSRLHADISVRPTLRLDQDLIGEMAGQLGFAAYAVTEDTQQWLGLGGVLARSVAAAWLTDHVPPDQVVSGADSFVVLREMAAAGLGRAILPCCLGNQDLRLTRLRDVMPPVSVPIWVASHADLVDAPRLRTVRARLTEALLAQTDVLSGLNG